jgi:CO/xanthine dehydrogenase FAD-binding subunit
LDLARTPRGDLEGLIDISRVGLSYVREENGGVRIGATTTLTEVLESQAAREYLGGFLVEVVGQVASPPLRNQATIGGAVVSAHPWADIPTALVALGAEVRWVDQEGEHRAALEDLWAKPFRQIFRRGVLTELYLPFWQGAFAFQRLACSACDIALLNCACGLGIEGGRIAWARVALGATPHRGRRLPWLEEFLIGKVPGEELWEEVRYQVEINTEVGTDRRANADWRRRAARVLVVRVVGKAVVALMGA